MAEIFVSTDVEADGPIPGPHSMLSFASAVYTQEKELIATYSANLELLPGAAGHPETMRWWKTEPEAWAAHRENIRPPEEVMPEYAKWVEALPGKPVFVAYPAGFDFTYMFWYLMRFAGRCPFSWSALDIKTFAMSITGLPYRKTVKPRLPQAWFEDFPHTHVALDDALEQGALFCNMWSFWKEQRERLGIAEDLSAYVEAWRAERAAAKADEEAEAQALAAAAAAGGDAAVTSGDK